jgi:hypothetical protein
MSAQRYLRKLYPDPLTGKVDWELNKVGDGIMGVYSKSQMTPIKTSGFRERDKEFEGANHFSDWKFLHKPPKLPPAAAGKPPSGPGIQFPAPPTGFPLQAPAPMMGTPAPSANPPGTNLPVPGSGRPSLPNKKAP